MQRNLTIAAIIVVVIGLAAGAYFYFATSTPGIAVTPGSTSLPIAGQVPSAGSGGSTSGGTAAIASPGTPVTVSSRLVQISAGPVVPGEAAYDTRVPVASSSRLVASVHYIERQSGNVFSYSTDTHTLTRINNKTIPGIQSATWLPDASIAFVRYLSGSDSNTINTYALASTSPNGFFLPQNLSDVAVASTSILTLASGVNGSVASLSRADGTHASTVFTTPLTSLRAMFAGKTQYLAFSKPSSKILGDAFLVSSSGHFSRIAGPLTGLVALASPSGKWVLVSYTQGDTLQMEIVSSATGETIVLPVATIADKCVWTADETSIYCGIPQSPAAASYPDDWYQGAVSFSDRIWNIHVADRYAQMVLDFSQANRGTLDATALAIDPAKTTLVFMNKSDESLWAYSL